MDKSWMTKSRGTREYRDGCRSFVDYAIRNCTIPDGLIYCPCKACRLSQRHLPGVVLAHLTGGKGIITTYKDWIYHGERPVRGQLEGSNSNCPATYAGPTQDTQPVDPARRPLDKNQVRVISINPDDGSEVFEVIDIKPLNKLWGLPGGKRMVCEYNLSWQPVGQSASKFSRMTGKIIRSGTYVRICDDWMKVTERTKEDIWDALMKHFYVPPESNIMAVKRNAFKDMGSKLKTWRHELKQELNIKPGDTPEIVRARVRDQRISKYDRMDIEIMLNKWCDKKNQECATYMKRLRSMNNTPHCTGSKSFARVTHEETIDTGTPPTRAQSYIKTHKNKDDQYPNDVVKKRCERMEELIPTDPAASSSMTEGTVRWAPNDAYAQAHGNKPEYAGRVRQVGPYILPVRGNIHSYYTPSQARSQNPVNSTVAEMIEMTPEAEREQHRAQMDMALAARDAQMAEQVAEQIVGREAQMVTQLAENDAQMAAKDASFAAMVEERFRPLKAMFEERFRQLEAMFQLRAASEVTRHNTIVSDTESTTRLIVRSSVGSASAGAEKSLSEDDIDLD
ncbi:uncharacterized protein LOC132179516 [Corylus avellana]|uniref:uncharacterized protein LOC132179516 n=1 Tax=Corylus avellana TaxID=13451 RepID=UPI00286CEBFC|nr:uncharacterized protein LOC132179516 [Corylus avellana]